MSLPCVLSRTSLLQYGLPGWPGHSLTKTTFCSGALVVRSWAWRSVSSCPIRVWSGQVQVNVRCPLRRQHFKEHGTHNTFYESVSIAMKLEKCLCVMFWSPPHILCSFHRFSYVNLEASWVRLNGIIMAVWYLIAVLSTPAETPSNTNVHMV